MAPSNFRAVPVRPGAESLSKERQPWSVPLRPCFDASAAVVPDASSNFHQPARCVFASRLAVLSLFRRRGRRLPHGGDLKNEQPNGKQEK